MNDLRSEIRAIIREELAVCAEQAGVEIEIVKISNNQQLQAFALKIVKSCSDKLFVEKVLSGRFNFVLEDNSHQSVLERNLSPTSNKQIKSVSNLKILSESDVNKFEGSILRVPKNCCITPLAKDEAERRNIRIERMK